MKRDSRRSVIPWLMLAVVALIATARSIRSTSSRMRSTAASCRALGQLSWQRAGRGDRIANVLLYLPLGFCLFLWIATRFNRLRFAGARDAAGERLLSLTIEVRQVYISCRVPSLTDLMLNALGALLGATGGLAGADSAR